MSRVGSRRFVIVGQTAVASQEFILDDFAGSSGRLDVLARSVRPALLFSHGVRRDAIVDLVLLGGPRAPRVVRIAGADVKFLRPEERTLGTLLQKVLATSADDDTPGFVTVKPGIAVARGGLERALADLHGAPLFVLEEGAPDVREVFADALRDAVFVLGDHLGFRAEDRALLDALGARPIGLGPTSLHTDDAIAVLTNELDRRG